MFATTVRAELNATLHVCESGLQDTRIFLGPVPTESPCTMTIVPSHKYISLTQTKLKRHRAHQYRFYFCFILRGYKFINSYSQCSRQGPANPRLGQRGPKRTHALGSFGLDSALLKEGSILNPSYETWE
jgi:hypothetical protein